ncbi:MAG: GNAT family N-acetyltransferase [Acidipropionibacterium sp.]|jgi:ribosomal protein S18 acetylase RimI-like enzyme|nr:GNAT family N-acetyltransferase [Acidipropionibacterium sp.]
MSKAEAGVPAHLYLHRATGAVIEPSAPGGVVKFGPVPSPEELAPLMLDAYRGTPDDEGETLEDTIEILRSAVAGGFGPWLAEVSFVGLDVDGRRLGAILTALDEEGTPFVAFVFTHPGHAGRGVASALISQACSVLAAMGYPDLRLWVNARNERALRLYRHLGFTGVSG